MDVLKMRSARKSGEDERRTRDFAAKQKLLEGIIKGARKDDEKTEALVEKLCRSSVTIDTRSSGGSGVIIHSDGEHAVILTCRHVIEPAYRSKKAKSLKVHNDGRTAEAVSLMIAPGGIDLAMLEVRGDIGPVAPMSFVRPRPGAGLIVIGAGMGIDNSVSMGIVSKVFKENARGGFEYDVIHTDAATNPGNSGGGLFRANTGELVGILSYKLVVSGTHLAEGGFAIAVDTLERIAPDGWKAIKLR